MLPLEEKVVSGDPSKDTSDVPRLGNQLTERTVNVEDGAKVEDSKVRDTGLV